MSAIAVIDASRTMRFMIAGAVEAMGYRFLEAGSAASGIALLESNRDDVALVIAESDGFDAIGDEVVKAMRENAALAAVPIMLIVRECGAAAREKAIRAGAVNYITAPFHHEELILRVIESLDLAQTV